MENYILQCNNLAKIFGNRIALNGINIALGRGRIIGLLGPNGSGKTTLIKVANGLLVPTSGNILIGGKKPGFETKKIVSYLPDKNYLSGSMRVRELLKMFEDFYEDFDKEKANGMIQDLGISPDDKLKTLSKGNQEKVQLILVMSRRAELYLLDEPIGGVDPATRDYILNTIIKNHCPNSAVVISTHLIADVEGVLDDVIFIKNGNIVLYDSADDVRSKSGKSIDEVFREVFRC